MKNLALPFLLTLALAVGFLPRAVRVAPEVAVHTSLQPRAADAPNVDEVLPRVVSLAHLKRLLRQAEARSARRDRGSVIWEQASGRALPEAARAEAPAAAAAQAEPSYPAPGDYSRTNVQVQGVDEADVVKTDGTYIYQVNGGRVLIIRAHPAEEMRLAATVEFTGEDLQPVELYVDEKRLAVVARSFAPVPLAGDGGWPGQPRRGMFPVPPRRGMVKVLVYDITDRECPQKVREAEVEGDYLSSRKIGGALYLVANRYAGPLGPWGEEAAPKTPSYRDTAAGITPAYRDTAAGDGFQTVRPEDIRYFPDALEPNYLIVAGLDLDRPGQPLQVATFLGAGQTIYASPENLYVAVTRYAGEPRPLGYFGPTPPEAGTTVYRFALEGGRASFRAKGEVPGTILNQFSMDELRGVLNLPTAKAGGF